MLITNLLVFACCVLLPVDWTIELVYAIELVYVVCVPEHARAYYCAGHSAQLHRGISEGSSRDSRRISRF